MHHRPGRAIRLAALALAALAVLWGRAPLAHDLPDEIIVQSFIKPADERLHFLVRVPLALLEGLGLPKRGPGYLDLERIDEAVERSWVAVEREFLLYEDGVRLVPERAATRISQPSEDSFGSFEEARAHVTGPALPASTNVFWNQGYFDVYLTYRIASEESAFALDMRAGPGLAGRLKLLIEFLPPGGETRRYEVHGGHGWLELDPSWHGAAWRFTERGFDHVLGRIDHLLFLLCLVLPFRALQVGRLAGIIAAFAVAHSLTLIAAATGLAPSGDWLLPLVEALIAVSIVWMALENVLVLWLGAEGGLRWRWLVAGAFGLVYGFDFSFALQEELQFAGAHFVLSLLAFNAGVELGQIAVLLVLLPVLTAVLRSDRARRAGVIVVSVLVGHTAWHWMLERMADLRFVSWPWADLAWPSLAAMLLAAGCAVVLGAVLWWLVARTPPRGLQRRF